MLDVLKSLTKRSFRKIFCRQVFESSGSYWEDRYASGGTSGDGSYSVLAEFKADIINAFVAANKIGTVIEYGCGDGNQLKLSNYPKYIGYDVSPKVISVCKQIFSNDRTKEFRHISEAGSERAELCLSLDVIYHLVEDDVYQQYMSMLFAASLKHVIIYSTNTEENPPGQAPHVKHREFMRWIDVNAQDWKLIEIVKNKHPWSGDTKSSSMADFFMFSKTDGGKDSKQ